jgi:hypothetical protein
MAKNCAFNCRKWARLSRTSARCSQPLPARMFRIFIQVRCSGAGGARTHDRRIMRTTARRSPRSTCTDTTEPCHRWPSLHCMHGWLGPRTGPRPPQRAPDVNYGASPHTARDPPSWNASSESFDPCDCKDITGISVDCLPIVRAVATRPHGSIGRMAVD